MFGSTLLETALLAVLVDFNKLSIRLLAFTPLTIVSNIDAKCMYVQYVFHGCPMVQQCSLFSQFVVVC